MSRVAPKGKSPFSICPMRWSPLSLRSQKVLFTSPQERQEVDETTGVALLKRHQQPEMPTVLTASKSNTSVWVRPKSMLRWIHNAFWNSRFRTKT